MSVGGARAWQNGWRIGGCGCVGCTEYPRTSTRPWWRGRAACAGFCEKPSDEPLLVDHCHATGRVRKLLCRKCNTVLGFCGDDHRLLTAAADYLKQAAAKAEADGRQR